MQQLLPDNSIRSLALALGTLPDGDAPKAWYSSMHPEVITGWDRYKADRQAWNDGYAELLHHAGLSGNTQYVSHGGQLIGILPKFGNKEAKISRWLRWHKNGTYLVPRRRTTAERTSEVNALFAKLEKIPSAVEYLPGMPDTLWTDTAAHPVHVRRSGDAAVLVFLGATPEEATELFEPNECWTRMKISTFHLLRERQEAGKL